MERVVESDESKVAALRGLFDREWRVEKEQDGTKVSSLEDGKTFWLRVQAAFPVDAFPGLADVLDTNLATRQKEWHELLLEGGGILAETSKQRQVCYFAYRSPGPISDRDCLYVKVSQSPDPDTLMLFYWTIVDDALMPPDAHRVRIDFRAAHAVRRGQEGVSYDYIQCSDAKLMLPNFILKSAQVKILFGEVAGLRRAVAPAAQTGGR
jgi:hypothetical protein